MSLYNILKAAKIGAASDVFTTLRAQQAPFAKNISPTPSEHEYTGTAPYTFNAIGESLIDWSVKGAAGGVGDKTGNLLNGFDVIGQVPSISNGALVSFATGATTNYIEINTPEVYLNYGEQMNRYIFLYDENKTYIGNIGRLDAGGLASNTISGYTNAKYVRIRIDSYSIYQSNPQLMLNTGSTPKPYEPYGYELSVSCGGQTETFYLNSQLGANDTISKTSTSTNIPTVNGSNTFAVTSTVQPSEVYIKWKG